MIDWHKDRYLGLRIAGMADQLFQQKFKNDQFAFFNVFAADNLGCKFCVL